ncbi:DNA polymerase III subunit [Fulvivirga lutea]|uniref:DNA polymerase III subunit delta n=1 Tax=Fulvivirga lutea TaxID=2810512 RepID=A0A975A1Y0_9BACT|nr:DNA polymerase III subunit delta [Fulvivirga lutea]QSE98904.1 DNA polymerase III subunit delta [Fulvivirga lutea]
MRFSEIAGLEEKKKQLIGAVKNNNVAHAQLFAGKEGSPNLPMAIAYASYLNCESPTDDDSCGECPSCSKNSKYVHPDVHFVFPVSATKDIKSDEAISEKFMPDWRKYLTSTPFGNLDAWTAVYGGENKQVNISKRESREIIKRLSLKAFEGKYKIMIVWLPEYMHTTAANGILKILEEPPEDTVFILVSNDYDRLLTTITSRTQMVTIPPFDDSAIIELLVKEGIDQEQANKIAPVADGDLNTALRIANNLEDDSHELFANWMRSCFKRDFGSLVQLSEDYHKTSKLSQRSLFKYALSIYREALIYQNAPQINKVNGQVLEFTKKFSAALDETKISKISTLISEALYHLERNGSPKMIFLDLSLQIAGSIK